MMRRFWPLFLALFCWALVLLVPATRYRIATAWYYGNDPSWLIKETVEVLPYPAILPRAAIVLKQHPDDRMVNIFVASYQSENSALRRPGSPCSRNIEVLLRKYPRDPLAIRLRLSDMVMSLKSGRNAGVYTKTGSLFGAPPFAPSQPSPRTQWNELIALASRGQQIEPQNTFFDWVLLYGLYATNQDEEARDVLSRAALKTKFDDHSREQILSAIAFSKGMYGAPISELELVPRYASVDRSFDSAEWLVDCWTMENVVAERERGSDNRAFKAAFDLLKMGRIMRLEGYALHDYEWGAICESIAIDNAATGSLKAQSVNLGGSLSLLHNGTRTLHFHAHSKGRNDLTKALDAEWLDLTKWKTSWKSLWPNSRRTHNPKQPPFLEALNRSRTLLLRMLPSIMILGALFGLLARRFPDGTDTHLSPYQALKFCAYLLLFAVFCDLCFSFIDFRGEMLITSEYYGSTLQLMRFVGSWVMIGAAGGLLCFGLSNAVSWQKQQGKPQIPFKIRLRNFFAAPDDGLVRFDFGWVLGTAARSSLWIVLLAGVPIYAYWTQTHFFATPRPPDSIGTWLMVGALLIKLGSHTISWSSANHRSQTLRLGLRFVSEATNTFLVLISVLYALVAFASLPFAYRYQNRLEALKSKGVLQIVREKIEFPKR